MHLQKEKKKMILKKSYFEELAKNRNKPKTLAGFKVTRSKFGQSKKISLKKEILQFEVLENANVFQRFYSELTGDIQEKLPKAPDKFTSQTTKNYCGKTSCNVLIVIRI